MPVRDRGDAALPSPRSSAHPRHFGRSAGFVDEDQTRGIDLRLRCAPELAPRGDVVLTPGDHLYVIADERDEPLVRLMFGQQEEVG